MVSSRSASADIFNVQDIVYVCVDMCLWHAKNSQWEHYLVRLVYFCIPSCFIKLCWSAASKYINTFLYPSVCLSIRMSVYPSLGMYVSSSITMILGKYVSSSITMIFYRIIGKNDRLCLPNFQGHLSNFKITYIKKRNGLNLDFPGIVWRIHGGMAWLLACWGILTTFRTGSILVTFCLFSSF